MTCIVGIEHGGKVWMGGDSAVSWDNATALCTTSKVVRRGDYLIGGCGSSRAGNLVIYSAKLPSKPPTKNTEGWLVNNFVPALQTAFKDEPRESGEQSPFAMEFGFLIGCRGQLFWLDSDFSIDRCQDGYFADGSGRQPAMGALYATKKGMAPRQRILMALHAAEKYTPFVRGPFTVLSV